ncbi:MAG: M6 family metalloprotease domain-containing protein, partial [Gemmatimonadetes bacterium]|nr:M6 family metalloprotease domain-containing protein [Gemmatimonadota bacterium]
MAVQSLLALLDTAMRRLLSSLAVVLATAPFTGAAGQDVEMLGRRYGTPVPEGYDRMRRVDPTAFEFQRGLHGGRGLEFRAFDGRSSASGPALNLGPRDPVLGTYRIPVILGLYSNSGATPPYTQVEIDDAYFGGGAGTITSYYTEVSNSRVTLQGDVFDWVQTARPDTAYTVGESGLVSGGLGGQGAGNFVYELLDLQTGVDWGLYDNDGPDGVPNSGDDDGFVDVLAVIHPTRGGECGGSGSTDRIWSHRWSLSAAVGTVFTTDTPRSGGGFIGVDDYTIQPSVSCTGGNLNEIGVFTHELGHAFGLPDLYDTCDGGPSCPDDGARTSGSGVWDLMASGSWGCNNASPASPCHMGAWTKAALGWVDVVTLAADADHGLVSIPPVVGSGTVYRVDANDGSGEYFLLENRQREGFDQSLYREGLLIWQIDPDWVAGRWGPNHVNANEHQGVWLRQADGDDDLGAGVGRGDSGDPFPGSSGNTAFHTVTLPGSISFGGGVTGVTLFDIQESGDDITLN